MTTVPDEGRDMQIGGGRGKQEEEQERRVWCGLASASKHLCLLLIHYLLTYLLSLNPSLLLLCRLPRISVLFLHFSSRVSAASFA